MSSVVRVEAQGVEGDWLPVAQVRSEQANELIAQYRGLEFHSRVTEETGELPRWLERLQTTPEFFRIVPAWREGDSVEEDNRRKERYGQRV